MSEKRKTVALVFGAGGARGACHVGVIKSLLKHDIPIDFITGSSMGAVVGGVYASGLDINEIETRFKKIKMTDIMDIGLRVIRDGGFFVGNKSKRVIAKHLVAKTFEETKIPFKCVSVDLVSGKPIIIDSGPLDEGIRASIGIPGVFQPVKKDGMLLVDGGVLCRVPIGAAETFNPDIIIAVDALGKQTVYQEKNPNVFQVLFRMFELLDWKNAKKELSRANVLITPDMPDISQFSTKGVAMAIDLGEKATDAKIKKIKQLLEK